MKVYFNITFVLLLFFLFQSCNIKVDDKSQELTSNVEEVKEELVDNIIIVEEAENNSIELNLDTLPFIESNVVKELTRKLKRWLAAYDLDIKIFKQIGEVNSFDWEQDAGSMYYHKFEATDDVYLPKFHDYSPNKTMYVNLAQSRLVGFENDTLKYFGGDDCQEVYLTNRTLKKNVMILWLGAGAVMEDCFWLDNTKFVLVGFAHWKSQYVPCIYVYDLSSFEYKNYIGVIEDGKMEELDYFIDCNLLTRGCPLKLE